RYDLVTGVQTCAFRSEVQHKSNCRFSLSKSGRQAIVPAAVADPRRGSIDVDIEGEAGVVIEPRHIAEVDLEPVRQIKRFDHAPRSEERRVGKEDVTVL